MKVVIQLGSSDASQIIVDLPNADPSLNEILAEVRLRMNPWNVATMERGINGLENGVDSLDDVPQELPLKSTMFLCLPPTSDSDPPKRLEGTLCASYYGITDGSVLQLMCSSIIPENKGNGTFS